ncbi:hypothetical protein Tco_0370531 [Tanacetum coccineum]
MTCIIHVSPKFHGRLLHGKRIKLFRGEQDVLALARDDILLRPTIEVISKHKDTITIREQFLPQHLTNQAMLESEAYKTYRAYATGEKAPKSKVTTKNTDTASSPKTKLLKLPKSRTNEVLDEQQQTRSGTNEGAGDKPEVPDVPEYRSENDDNDDNDDEDNDQENDSQRTESDDEGDDFIYPNLSTYIADDQEKEKEEEKETRRMNDNGELYGDLNINLSRSDAEMIEAQTNPETEEAHVTLPTEPPVVQLQSSSKFINPSPDIDKLREEDQTENQDFLNSLDSNMKRIIKEQVKAQTSKIMTKVKKRISMTEERYSEAYNSKQMTFFSSYGEVVTLKRGRDDQDKDEEPSAGSNRGSKRQRSGKEESSKEVTQNGVKVYTSSKGTTKSPPKSSGKSVQEEEHDPRVDDPGNHFIKSSIQEMMMYLLSERQHNVDERLWNPSGSRTPDREWNQTKTVDD